MIIHESKHLDYKDIIDYFSIISINVFGFGNSNKSEQWAAKQFPIK